MYCFLQIQPFAAQLLDNTQGAPGIPSVRVRPGRSGLEQNLSELVIHTTTVLQSINHVTICEPLRLLMDNPAALMVQFSFRFSFLFFFLFLKEGSYRLSKCKIWIASKMDVKDVLLAVLRWSWNNEINKLKDSCSCRKMTSSCNWPIEVIGHWRTEHGEGGENITCAFSQSSSPSFCILERIPTHNAWWQSARSNGGNAREWNLVS